VRWESAGEGEFTVEMVEKAGAAPTSSCTCARARTSSCRAGSCADHPQVLRPHHAADPDEEGKWDEEKKEQVATDEDETVNQASALWARPKSEITDEQYKEFYKHVAHDFEDPLAYVHARVEGKQEYTQLLYIPAARAVRPVGPQRRHGIKLYVRRVFIMDDAEQLMPLYLRFVRGVVDSADLPLNVSREILQESRDIEDDPRRLRQEGAVDARSLADSEEAPRRRSTPSSGASSARCSRKASARTSPTRSASPSCCASPRRQRHADETVSLADYVSRMKEGQEKIYYVTAETFTAAKNSPHLEIFRKKGIEVLLLSDRVDEWVTGT
jgi:molecular chaperone HtpG